MLQVRGRVVLQRDGDVRLAVDVGMHARDDRDPPGQEEVLGVGASARP
jgi:hypothetical protein